MTRFKKAMISFVGPVLVAHLDTAFGDLLALYNATECLASTYAPGKRYLADPYKAHL